MTPRFVLSATLLSALLGGTLSAQAQLRWPAQHKESIEVRLVAVAVEYPRTSFFANDEVLIAEQELTRSETRFIKLVYDFLPYQSPLSAVGLSYAVVHHFRAVRDTTCDESLWQMRQLRASSGLPNDELKYAPDSPISDLEQRQARLRCYRVTSDDYEKAARQPTSEVPY